MKCIACGNMLEKFTGTSYLRLPVFFCRKCFLYVTGSSEQEIKEKSVSLYEKEYWDNLKSDESLQSDFTNVDSQGKRRRWISQYAYLKPYLENKTELLEIGSGAGQAIVWFDEIGFSVTGIEPDARNVEQINKKLRRGKCFIGFAEEFDLEKKFDIIWISHVFEHLIKPDLLLEKLKNKLNNDGVIFIEVPNCENKEILDSSINENPSTFHFSRNSLILICQNSGFNIIRCDYFRSPKTVEGLINKIFRIIIKKNLYQYYPKLITSSKKGTDIRIILKVSKEKTIKL